VKKSLDTTEQARLLRSKAQQSWWLSGEEKSQEQFPPAPRKIGGLSSFGTQLSRFLRGHRSRSTGYHL
jgi:hypothetical protein